MFDGFFDILAKNGKSGGWKEFIPLLVIFGFFMLKNLGNLKLKKGDSEDKKRPPDQPPSRRYAPLDEKGRAISRLEPARRVEPVRQELRREPARPLAPAQAKIMPEHGHAEEFTAIKRYKAKQEMRKKHLADQRRIAEQLRQKAATKAKPVARKITPKEPERPIDGTLEIIESASEVTVDSFISEPENLRTAFIMSEVLGKPIAMRN